MISISSNLNVMIKAAEKASKLLIRDFGEVEKLQVSKKGPRDFVTKTDKRVEKIIIEELSKTKKNFSFLSEEIGKIKNKDEIVPKINFEQKLIKVNNKDMRNEKNLEIELNTLDNNKISKSLRFKTN